MDTGFTQTDNHENTSIAFLRIRDDHRPTEYGDVCIYPAATFDIGREFVHQVTGTHDMTISLHHLRFRCVHYENEFEEPNEDSIPSLIYVRVLSSNNVALVPAGTSKSDRMALGRDGGDTLLNHGDRLQLTPQVTIEFFFEHEWVPSLVEFNPTILAESRLFSKRFQLTTRKLGRGGMATVYLGLKLPSRRQLACKIIRRPLPPDDRNQKQDGSDLRERHAAAMDRLAREYELLKDITHPNIIKLEKVFCTSYHVYIFQELSTGGDLMSYACEKQSLKEGHAALITRQLLEAVKYLHENHIAHRDIKPENILVTSWNDGCRVVLTDFGQAGSTRATLSKSKVPSTRMHSYAGTPGYMAPELMPTIGSAHNEEGYSSSVDIYSIGSVTAMLLTGKLLFPDQNFAEPDKDRFQDLDFIDYEETWQGISRKAKSFIKACVAEAGVRLTAVKALQHVWLTNKHYVKDLEAAYRHAIEDWNPRRKSDRLVEFLDTTSVVPRNVKTTSKNRQGNHVRSEYFAGNASPPAPIDPVHHHGAAQASPLSAIGETTEPSSDVPGDNSFDPDATQSQQHSAIRDSWPLKKVCNHRGAQPARGTKRSLPTTELNTYSDGVPGFRPLGNYGQGGLARGAGQARSLLSVGQSIR